MDSLAFAWSAPTAPRPPHRRIHRDRDDDPPRYSAPPRPTLSHRGATPPAMNVASTAGWGQHPQDQASAAAILWSAGEAAPRRLNATATTRSLFDGLAVHGEPPHKPESPNASAGIDASCTSEVRHQPTLSFASASHERANGAPEDPRRPRLPAAAFGRSAEVPDDLHRSTTLSACSHPHGPTESRRRAKGP